MTGSTNRVRRAASVALAAAALLMAPAVARADDGYRNVEQRLYGHVIEYKPWHLLLDRGPHMVLHPGTVIHPTGLNLRNGMSVRVIGHVTADGNFSADEIDLVPASPWDRFRS